MTPLRNKLGEETALRGTLLWQLAGENALWEERYFAEMLNENSAGDTIDVLCWKV